MKRVYVSTVGRGKALEESSKVYLVDMESGQTLKSARIPEPTIDLANPRGGCRGCRGLTWHRNRLWAAGFDGLFKLDPETLLVQQGFWSQECRDIHQIYSDGDEIFGTSTWNDSIFSFEDGSFYLGPNLGECFQGAQIHSDSPDTLHLNSLCGDYALLNRPGQIVNWKTNEVLYQFSATGCGHDLQLLNSGEIAINLASDALTSAIDLKTGRDRTLLWVDRDPSLDGPLAHHGWTRGMSYIPGEDTLLIGSAPAMVYQVENVCDAPSPAKMVRIADEVVETVFDVIPHPEDWDA